MFGIQDYWLFVITCVLLNLTPGQDTFFILGRSIADGSRAGIASALGISTGALIHTVFAAVGLSALLATSESAFFVVKLAGAVYLVYLGTRMILRACSGPSSMPVAAGGAAGSAFRDGVLTNLLNPKVALFFLALMPQFIAPGSADKVAAFLVLGLTFVTTGVVWCLVLATGAGRMRGYFLRHPRGWRMVSGFAGGLFVLLGLRLAASRA